jgi:type 2 lantibiotic biosynthesis protein LanM
LVVAGPEGVRHPNLDLATTVAERLAADWRAEAGPEAQEQAARLLALWAERSARGDAAAFARRLSWDGLDPEALRRVLTPGRLTPRPLPSWVATFHEVSELAAGGAVRPEDALWRDPGEPLPFEEILVPWIEVARRRRSDAGELSPEAWRDLERWLATRLAGFAAGALGAAFDRFRGGRPGGFAIRLAEAGVGRDTHLYHAFVEGLLREGLTAWARELPVLARLLAEAVDLWVGCSLDLVSHYRQDGAAVQREILGHLERPLPRLPRIVRIAAGLSDAHGGGRTTHILTLEGGARVVYKARSLGMDVAFSRWLAWCNERGAPSGVLDHALHRLLDRGGRGWAEFVAMEPCPDAAAARRFHLRAGQLLALLHASGARDAHFENLIAQGEHPVMIDLEAWLPPRLTRWLPAPEDDSWADAALRLEHSVLATGLLPRWQPDGPRDEVVDVGGLGGGRPGIRHRPVWRAVNTDLMVRAWSPVDVAVQPNVPVLDGHPLAPADWAREVGEGFAAMHRFLRGHREELLAPGGPLADLAGLRGRLIFRPTRAYVRLRDRSVRPDACRDAAARGGELDALARVYLDAPGENVPATWPLLAAERRALEQGDIPIFHADLAGTVLEGPAGERIPQVIDRPAVEALQDRLRRLDPEDLEEQLGYIEVALAPSTPDPARREKGTQARSFLDTALDLAETIRRRALRGRDGRLAWVGPRYLAGGETFELAPLGTDLYRGTGGIALFFAALERVAGGGGWGELALRCALPGTARDPEGIGGLVGLGARIYTLVALGALLGEAEPIREAHRVAARITPERIAADARLDVTLGTAGALLALLALDAALPAQRPAGPASLPHPLETAAACVRHLLAHRLPGARAWAAPGRPPEAGFAHGAAGIAYALARFAARTGDEEAQAAALQAISFERTLLAAETAVQTTWCRGLPGVALARLGALDVLDLPADAEVRDEIRAALAATRASALTPMDHLCCGNLGRADILLEAGAILAEAELSAAARELAGQVLARAAARGGLSWLPSGQVSGFDPSFFRGAAGAGYALLRLTVPGDLPCVLRLEPPTQALQSRQDICTNT